MRAWSQRWGRGLAVWGRGLGPGGVASAVAGAERGRALGPSVEPLANCNYGVNYRAALGRRAPTASPALHAWEQAGSCLATARRAAVGPAAPKLCGFWGKNEINLTQTSPNFAQFAPQKVLGVFYKLSSHLHLGGRALLQLRWHRGIVTLPQSPGGVKRWEMGILPQFLSPAKNN